MEKNTLNTNPGGNLSESKCQSRYATKKWRKPAVIMGEMI